MGWAGRFPVGLLGNQFLFSRVPDGLPAGEKNYPQNTRVTSGRVRVPPRVKNRTRAWLHRVGYPVPVPELPSLMGCWAINFYFCGYATGYPRGKNLPVEYPCNFGSGTDTTHHKKSYLCLAPSSRVSGNRTRIAIPSGCGYQGWTV
jgi:hypothetical protein